MEAHIEAKLDLNKLSVENIAYIFEMAQGAFFYRNYKIKDVNYKIDSNYLYVDFTGEEIVYDNFKY